MITSAYAHEVMTVVGTDSGPSQSLSDATVIVDGTVMEWASDVDGGSMISIEQPEVSDHFGASSISREILSAERIDQVDLSYDSEGHTSLHPITVNRSSTSWDGGQEYTGSEFLDGHNDDDSGQISATDDTRSQPIYTSLMTGMMDEYQTINDRSPTGADEHVAVTTEQRTLKVTFITRFDDDYTLYFEWDAPPTSRTSQGKSSGIQGYHFEHRVGTSSWSKTTMGLTSSMDLARVFTGRGVTFSFRIRARYGDAGNEPWSNIVTFTTYDVPDAPTNLQAEASGETTINLSWSAPSEDGGLPIKKYRVESSPDGTSGWKYVGIRSGATSTTYSHRFLDPRTTRYYRVIAYNDIGYGESSNVASATTEGKAVAPDAPTGLSATAMGGNEIHLSWTAPSENGGAEIIGYRIETSRYANFNWSELEDDTGNDETTYEHTNLSPGSTRFYRVSAINSAGTSVVSNTVSATTLSLPGAPTNLTATASGSTRINLSWRAPSDNGGAAITGYRIETWIGSSWTTVQENTGSTTPSYTVRNLRPSTSRYYRVFTITSVGTGPRSLSVLGTTGVPGDGTATAPDAPTGLSAQASGRTTINLSWTAPDDGGSTITGFRIEVSTDGGKTFKELVASQTLMTFTHRGLSAGTMCYYRVFAINSEGRSSPSTPASATTPAREPDAPTGLTARASGSTTINLSWTAPDNGGAAIRGYLIEESTDGGSTFSELVASHSTTTYSHTGLDPSTTRHYQVSAINSVGTGSPSTAASATTGPATPTATAPDAPTGLTARASGSTTINLSWTAPDNGGAAITGYLIEESTDGGSTFSELVASHSTTTYSHTGLDPGTTRHYRVSAINSVNTGSPSTAVSATTGPATPTATAPDAPTGLTARASGSTTINLSWTAPDNGGAAITGYLIEESTDGGSTFSELVASHSTTTYSHTGLDPGTTRHYRVSAINSVNTGSPSTAVSATTEPATPTATAPDAPTGLTARASGSTTINLSWTAPDNGGAAITGYLIEESTDGGSTFSELVASHSTTTYSHTGLDPGTTRHYRVSAINSVNTGSPSTAVSATTEPASTVTAPAAPTGLTARASGSATISLSWTAPDDGGATITGYLIEVSTDGGSTFSELVPRHSTTTYSHTGLDPSTTRHYRVSAINSAGTGSASTVVSATTEPASILTVSSAPTGLTATASGSTTITLSWTSPSDDGGAEITGYRIEVSPNGASEWIDLASNTGSTATSYSHTNLLPETTRYYRVSAINSVGESDLSNIDNATTDPVASLSFITSIGDQTYPVGIAIADLVLPEASGGVMPKEYTLTPSLPTGLTIDRSTRTINGTPSDITSETMYTWTVEDAAGTIVNLKFSLEVYSLSFDETIENLSLSRGQTITTIILPEANGGVSPIQYTLNLLDLPLGLMYDASTRSITGTPLVISPPVPFTFTALDSNGAQDSLKFTIEVISTVHSEENPDLTENFVVHSNYPNPFVHSTHLVFDLPWSAQVSVEVLDITGRQVYERPPIHINAGTGHELELNDLKVPSGSYIYRMIATSRDNGSEAIHVGHFMSVR